MPETQTITRTVYTYDELDDQGKSRVTSEYVQFLWDSGAAREDMEEIATHIASQHDIRGFKLVEYDLGRGDYLWFDGTFIGVFIEPKRPGRRRQRYDLNVSSRDISISPHSDTATWAMGNPYGVLGEAARDFVYNIAQEMLEAMCRCNECYYSEEVVRENAEANEFRYLENGEIA